MSLSVDIGGLSCCRDSGTTVIVPSLESGEVVVSLESPSQIYSADAEACQVKSCYGRKTRPRGTCGDVDKEQLTGWGKGC